MKLQNSWNFVWILNFKKLSRCISIRVSKFFSLHFISFQQVCGFFFSEENFYHTRKFFVIFYNTLEQQEWYIMISMYWPFLYIFTMIRFISCSFYFASFDPTRWKGGRKTKRKENNGCGLTKYRVSYVLCLSSYYDDMFEFLYWI